MQHTRTWTDIYASACASFEGRAGGHRWLVAAPPFLAANIPDQLAALDGKGTVNLLVHDHLTPLLMAVQELAPRGVVIVAPAALAAGPAVNVPAEAVITDDGLSYHEGGNFPAWTGWNSAGEPGEHAAASNAAASAVASLGVPLAVVTPDAVQAELERWMGATPHGR